MKPTSQTKEGKVGGAGIGVKRVLLPVDLSSCTLSFLQQALVFVRSHDADIIIMHVHPTGTMDAAVPGAIQMNSELAEHRLTDLKEALDYPAEKIFLVIETGVVATHILKCVRMMSVDLVVMGAHMRGTAHKLLIGSATKGVLQKTDVPILVIPQKD